MTDAAALQRIADEADICRVRRLWGWGRDQGDWALVESCFNPGATVTVSWYAGPVAGFIERSKVLTANRKPEERSKHWFGNQRVIARGARATLETDVQILTRDRIDGHLFDYTSWGRFFDLFENQGGGWRISRWSTIYDKDRLDPVVPGSMPPSFFDGVALEGAASGFAYMAFRQAKIGRSVPPGIVIGGSADERALKADGEAWLAGS